MLKNIWFYLKPLFCDNGGGMSLGRIAFWIVLIKAISVVEVINLIEGKAMVTDIPQYLFYTLAVLLAYNLSKKSDVFIKLIHAYNGNDVKLAEIEAGKLKADGD